jgi:RNA polymerase sigma factor (sigma-70 family)
VLKTRCQFLDDVVLLERIRDFNDEQAYKEFVNRYLPAVKQECLNKCKLRNVDKHVGIQIAHETFEKVKKSKSFKKRKLNGTDSKTAITGWLYRISSNLFYDYHNSEKKDNEINESYFDELVAEANEICADSLADTRDITVKILAKLNAKEKEVVITDLEYKRNQKYLPSDVNETLAKNLGVKKPTVRKIRERAIAKLKKAINEINK